MVYAMMLKTLNKYLKYSGVWITVVVNPYHWQFKINTRESQQFAPDMCEVTIYLGPICLRACLDNGDW